VQGDRTFAIRGLTWLGLPPVYGCSKFGKTGVRAVASRLRIRPNHLRFYAATEQLPPSASNERVVAISWLSS